MGYIIRGEILCVGKHKGDLLRDVSSGYLHWMLNSELNLDITERRTIEAELDRRTRGNVQLSQLTLFGTIRPDEK